MTYVPEASIGATGSPVPASGMFIGGKDASGNLQGALVDLSLNLRVAPGATIQNLAAWSSATSLNATQTLISGVSVPAVLVVINQTTPFTTGAITFELTYDDTNWITVPAAQVLVPSTLAQQAIPYTLVASTNQTFLILLQGARQVRIKLSTAITGAGTVTPFSTAIVYSPEAQLNSSGALKVDPSAVVTPIGDSLSQVQYNFPAGFVRTTDEPRQILYDPFDAALDTTTIWAAPTTGNSAVAASTTTGVMAMGTGTTASGWSKLTSNASFKPPVPAWIGNSFAIALPDGAAPTANAYRFWGVGTTPGTPTTAAPLTDAVGFELTTAGKLIAVVYSNGVRTAVQDLSSSGNSKQPLDANYHRYACYTRTDKIYWYIDSLATPVATSNFQSPSVQTLPVLLLAVGFSTPPVSNSQIQCTGLAVWDTGKNATQIADGTYPWRKAKVDSTGNIQVSVTNGTVPGNITQISGTAIATAGLGLQKVGIVGSAGAVVDGATAAAVPANAVLRGGRAATANPTAVTDGQMAAPMQDKLGRTVVVQNHVRGMTGRQRTQIASSSAETTVVTAIAATFADITGIQITNQSATAFTATLKDSTAGTTVKVFDIAANGGIVIPFNPPLEQTTVNNNWTITLSVATVTVNVNIDYVKNI